MDSRTKLLIGFAAVVLFAAGLWFAGVLPFGGSVAQAPSLERPINFPVNFPTEARPILEANVVTLKERLRTNSEATDDWLDLAIQYKTVNDLDGAIEIWKYLGEAKQNPIAYYNLGSTAHLYLKEYADAESYYRKAIEIAPSSSINYTGLHELYRYSYKQDTTAAVDVLKDGLTKVDARGQIDLYSTLGAYYKDKGDKANALDAYTKARDTARTVGITALVTQFDKEIASLQ